MYICMCLYEVFYIHVSIYSIYICNLVHTPESLVFRSNVLTNFEFTLSVYLKV